MSDYRKIRRYKTDIHLYEFNPAEVVLTLTGETFRKPLSKINHDYWEDKGKVCAAAINAGYFGWNTKSDTIGVDYRDEGFAFSDTVDNDEFIELVYSEKKLHLFDGTVADIKARFPRAEWAISMGYSLVENGRISIRKAERFSHSYAPNPRTMIGQRKDGSILFAVAEGRNMDDKGLTATEQADVMLELGCHVAVNADGGGSSEMIVDGEIKNRLSDGVERSVATALMVYVDKKNVSTDKSEPTGDIVVPPTNDIEVIGMVRLAKNFTLDEIACRHCGKVRWECPDLIDVAQFTRNRFEKPIRVVGYRCPGHNKAIGGDSNSGHIYGRALDLSAWNNDIPPAEIYHFVKDFEEVEGLGIYSGHVHIDQHHNGKRVTWDNR